MYTSSWWSDYYNEDLRSRKQKQENYEFLILWSLLIYEFLDLMCYCRQQYVYYHCQWNWNAKWGSVDISTSAHINGFWHKQLNCATNHLRYFYIIIFNYFALLACSIVRPMKWINKLVWWIKFAQAIVQVIARFIHIYTVPF
jgi:hypothetical protein